MLTPSSRRLCRHHLLFLCRRLRLPPPRLLPRLVLVEGGHRQLPSDQEGLGRGILDVFCSCPKWYAPYPLATVTAREELFEPCATVPPQNSREGQRNQQDGMV